MTTPEPPAPPATSAAWMPARGGIDGTSIIRATFESAPDAVAALDAQGRILVCNSRFLALWSFPPEMLARDDGDEMRRHSAAQLLEPQRFLDHSGPLFAATGRHLLEEVAFRDGRVFERSVSPLGAPGVHGGFVVRWRDVSERDRAQRELAATQQRQQELTALLEMAMLGADLAYCDIDLVAGTLSSVNGHWHTMLGYEADEVGLQLSAWEQLVHPDDQAARVAAWNAHLRGETAQYLTEFRLRHKAGHWVWIQARGRVVAHDAQGRPTRMVGTRMDVSGRKLTEQVLTTQAHTDGLTGVYNRRRFIELCAQELALAARLGQAAALMMIDIDHFKAINDRHGHAAGDEVLCAFVHTARSVMRDGDIFARVGGEEFAALLMHTGVEGASALASRLVQHVHAQPAQAGGLSVNYTVSVGVRAVPAGSAGRLTVDTLMLAADRALYEAKAQGRDRVVVDGGP